MHPHAETVPHTPPLNALKHGLRSESTLLPGDDAAAFRAQRAQLFHLYQPRTVDEAFCVEQMSKLQWRIARCDRWQDVYDDQQEALLLGDPGLDSALCEADAHRSLHRPMDCELHAGRMDRRMCRARARLFELQHLRRQNLIPGKAAIAEDYRVFLGPQAGVEVEQREAAAVESADATPLHHGENGKSAERPTGPRKDGQPGGDGWALPATARPIFAPRPAAPRGWADVSSAG